MKIMSLYGNYGFLSAGSDWPVWKSRNHEGQVVEVEEQISSIDIPISSISHVSSMVTLEHPSGKWWESLFIPLSRSGNSGFSITTWGKKAGVAGSIQVKAVSETDWYGVVHSKVGAGGYGVFTYVGREGGLTSAQASAMQSMTASAKMPPMAMVDERATELRDKHGEQGMLAELMKDLMKVTPVEAFIVKAMRNGHSVPNHINGLSQDHKLPLPITSAIACAADGLNVALDSLGWASGHVSTLRSAPQPVVPPVNRDEVYGETWGTFG